MDPDATLNALRQLVEDVHNKENPKVLEYQFAEAFDAIDEWITNGGFLPEEWKND